MQSEQRSKGHVTLGFSLVHELNDSTLRMCQYVLWSEPVARWPGGQGGQLPPQLALKRGRQNDDRGAPAAKQITRNVFNYDGLFM